MTEKTMTDFFTMDPFDMTIEDATEIVKYFRAKRQEFIRNPSAVKATRSSSKPKQTESLDIKLDL